MTKNQNYHENLFQFESNSFIACILTSCNKNDFEEPTVKTKLNYLTIKSANFKSELINDYAKILAISLSDEIKNAIKEEALKRFDGDYDIPQIYK